MSIKNKKVLFISRLCRFRFCFFKRKEKQPQKAQTAPTNHPFPRLSICNLKDPYYTSREVSELLNVPLSVLARYRRRGIGPQYIILGYRSYRYPREEIIKFVEQQLHAHRTATKTYTHQL